MDLFTNKISRNRKYVFAGRWSSFKIGEGMCLGVGGCISLLDIKMLRCRSWSADHVSMFLLSSHIRFPCFLNNPKEPPEQAGAVLSFVCHCVVSKFLCLFRCFYYGYNWPNLIGLKKVKCCPLLTKKIFKEKLSLDFSYITLVLSENVFYDFLVSDRELKWVK